MAKASDGTLLPSPQRDVYYPIQYVWPYKGNEKALGFDISNTAALNAVERACSTGRAAATNALRLVQESATQTSIVFYAPVYKRLQSGIAPPACENLAGVTASVFRIEHELIKIQNRYPDFKLYISLINAGKQVYTNMGTANGSTFPTQFGFEKQYAFNVGGTEWEISYSPAPGFISYYSSWAIWMVIVGGLLIAAASGLALLLLTGRALRTEELVRMRTRELDREVRDRKYAAHLLAMEKTALQMITRERPLNEIAGTIAAGVEQILPESRCAILFLETGMNLLTLSAAPGLSPDCLEMLDNTRWAQKTVPVVEPCTRKNR
ncbi:MAG: CHASE domain-containing protein [Candidatus Competibacteraceae bacterium]